jgi:ABC-type dipeptide/oligopeptide/nickel transport system permease component
MTVAALLGISVPVFWLGLMMAYYFSVTLHILPSAGNATWQAFLMPTVCLAAFSVAFITRMTRSSLLEIMGQDFIRTARAKGLRESVVVGGHALRNALVPVVTVIGLRFGYMLGGAVITEQVFAWPGLGRLLVTSVTQRDIPMIQGALLIFGASFVLVNLAVDLLYTFLDPRIRYR